MSALVDRITEVLRQHYTEHVFVPPDVELLRCACDLRTFDGPRPWAAHVAERIAEALQLTEVLALRDRHREERWPSGTGSNCAECNGRRFPCPTRQVLDRWVSEWTPAEEQR